MPAIHARAAPVVCSRTDSDALAIIVEAWSQGVVVGSLVILFCLTIASMKSRVWLHKLILIELIFASFHGTFIFVTDTQSGWYLSATAVLLYVSYNLHNVINWIKIKPFLSKTNSFLYVGSVCLAVPYWVVEMYFNFAYNNNLAGGNNFAQTRPWEALCREPWWLLTTVYLIYIIKRCYNLSIIGLVRASPRFAILLCSMIASIAFVVTDAVQIATNPVICLGRNPYWKFALIFKCLADVIFLDDFKSVLDGLSNRNASIITRNSYNDPAVDASFMSQGHDGTLAPTAGAGSIGQDSETTNSLRMTASRSRIFPIIPQKNRMRETDDPYDVKDFGLAHVEGVHHQRSDRSPKAHHKEWFDVVNEP